jgi:tetratricopeptide (TPR) repeat protein
VVYVMCAGRQAIAVFGRGRAAERLQHVYSAAAGLVRLPADGRAKHSGRYMGGRVAAAATDTGPVQAGDPAAQRQHVAANDHQDVGSHAPLASRAHSHHQAPWLSQAVAAHERDVADRERLLGPYHPHTLASRHKLAFAYRQAGLLAKAIPLYEQSLADWKRLLGPDHPRTLRVSNHLAAAYWEAGRLGAAIPLYEQVLADRQRLLGFDHPSTLRSGSYMAAAYRAAGRKAEAIRLYEQTLAACARVLGDGHRLTRRVRHDLDLVKEETASQNRRHDASRQRNPRTQR